MKRIRIITLLAIAFLLIISINNIVRAEAGYGEVTAITGSPTISGTGTANVDIKYDTVSLEWAPADTSIGRNKNGYCNIF